MNNCDRQILKIAMPAIVTNITVPLLGLVDTAIVGHMGDASYIGAIAVGAMIFNLVYWVFGFLRMGTSGLTAQAYGRQDRQEMRHLLRQSLKWAGSIALLLILLQWPLCEVMLAVIGPTADVRPLAATYFYYVVWGAPASLGLFALTGWYIGMQNTRYPMYISILQNVTNILVSLLLVYGLGMKVEGVALGTVIAQYVGLLVGIRGVRSEFRGVWSVECGVRNDIRGVGSVECGVRDVSFFGVNRDIFLRTLFLVAVNLCFTAIGARQGATILAVNTLLMQLYLLFSYVMDGFAYAGEALGGRYWGARQRTSFMETVQRLFVWGGAMTILFTAVYMLGGMPFLHLLTDEPVVVEASRDFVWWAYLIPIAGVAAFVWDGVFIGITASRGMLLSAIIAAATFFTGVFVFVPSLGNHGLMLSMLLFLLMRGVVQTWLFCNRIAKNAI